MNLFLDPYLIKEGIVDRLISFNESFMDASANPTYYKDFTIDGLNPIEIKNSNGTISIMNGYRIAYYTAIYKPLVSMEEKKRLFTEMESKFPEQILPFINAEFEKYHYDLKKFIF
jgi:hypothetical protein